MQMQSGTVQMFVDYPNGNMWTGSGPRQIQKPVTFSPPFLNNSAMPNPKVIASLATIDSSSQANLRVKVSASQINPAGFVLTVDTWSDTKLAMIEANWIAYLV